MRPVVLSLTRDRLDYTKRAFGSLRENAGCEFAHVILDQGSTDGTWEWLVNEYEPAHAISLARNIGICAGLNKLLDATEQMTAAMFRDEPGVIVKVDNDIEVLTPGTLRVVCEVAAEGCLAGPRIVGLRSPPGDGPKEVVASHLVAAGYIGGAFMGYPPGFFDGWRFSEEHPVWDGDDPQANSRRRGQRLLDFEVRHDTDRHWADHPEYWLRKIDEGLPT